MVERLIAITSNQGHNSGCYFSQCWFVCVYVMLSTVNWGLLRWLLLER